MNARVLFVLFLIGGLFPIVAGCGNNGLVSLEGNVTVDGSPAPAGICLQFMPLGGGSPSYAQTDSAGHYEAAFTFKKIGIEKGEHRVSLVPGGGGDQELPEMDANGNPIPKARKSTPKLPRKYYEEITKIMVDSSKNIIDISLESEK